MDVCEENGTLISFADEKQYVAMRSSSSSSSCSSSSSSSSSRGKQAAAASSSGIIQQQQQQQHAASSSSCTQASVGGLEQDCTNTAFWYSFEAKTGGHVA